MFLKKVITSLPKSVLDSCKNNLTASRAISPDVFSAYQKSYMKAPIPEAVIKSLKTTGHDSAKLKCMAELIGDNPRELVCIVDKKSGKLLTSAIGSTESCVVDLGLKGLKGKDLILYHGHPKVGEKGITLPVSLQDFIVMNDSNIEKIVAFNSKGQQSYLKKNTNFVPLGTEDLTKLKNNYRKALLAGSNSSDTAKIKELIKYVGEHPDARGVKVEIIERLNNLQKQDTSKDIIDKFWRQNAHSYNLTYFSEF